MKRFTYPFSGVLMMACLALGVQGLASTPAKAAGFLVYDVSAEALGKGSAHIAGVSEPAAVFFNPAALAFMPGYQVSLGTVWVTANAEFEPKGGGPRVSALDKHFFLPTIYGSARVNEWMAVGLGVYTIFGLGIEWPSDWIGREHGIIAHLETVTFSPTMAFQLHKSVSLGLGLNVVRGVVDMTNGLPEAVGGTVRIGAATFGFGAHGALMWRILPNTLHAAVVYHSRAKLSFDGRADFEPEHEEFIPELQDQGGKSAITLPDILSFGLMYRPIPKLTLNLDVNVVFWSTYDKLVLDFEHNDSQVLRRNNKNVATFRIGAEYRIWRGLSGRLGFIYDMNPAPKEYLSPSLPDANRVDIGLGLGYEYKWLKVDWAYLLVNFLPSESVGGKAGPEGTYRSMAHLMALTVTGRFDMERYAEALPDRIHGREEHFHGDEPRTYDSSSPETRPASETPAAPETRPAPEAPAAPETRAAPETPAAPEDDESSEEG